MPNATASANLAQGVASDAASRSQWLRAGDIRVKFADGELRYLYVGDREIVRRIYFAVRNGKWATAAPTFSRMDVHQKGESFTVDLAADCRTEGVDYHWTGRIDGTKDGKITFQATGKSGAAFRSNRIGLCVLYGAQALAGHAFETEKDGDGAANSGTFPELVSPTLVRGQFNELHYKNDDGVTVTTKVAGTRFDMEDQRTYGDSSFKAYAPLTYAYPEIPAETEASETVTITVANVANPERVFGGTIEVGVDPALAKAMAMPTIETIPPTMAGGIFGDINNQSERHRGAGELTWAFAPSVHLLDDDAFMENTAVLADQVRTAHSYAPDAKITLAPIKLNSRIGADVAADPRNADQVGAAWAALTVLEMARGGIADGKFALGPGKGETLLHELAAYAGHPIHVTTYEGKEPTLIDVLAIEDSGKTITYLINKTDEAHKVAFRDAGQKRTTVELPPYAVVKMGANGK